MAVFWGRTKFVFCVSLVVLIWMNVCMRQVSCGPDVTAQMQKVKERILKNYDRYIRPTNGTNTTEVHTAFIPRQIIELDEEHSLFTMDSFLFMSWLDPRLQWNTTDYMGYFQLPANMLWVPDISVYNSHSQQVNPTNEVLLAFDAQGSVWWVPPIQTVTSCPTDSSSVEKVLCEIRMGSWMHDGWAIDFHHSDWLILDEFENINPHWELIEEEATIVRNVTYYECCPEPYLSIVASLPMRRRPVPAITATRVSCILVMLLTLVLLVFLGRSITSPVLLSFAVSFVQTTMYLVVLTVLLQIFIVIKIASLSGPSRPPPAVTHLLTGPLGKYACLRSPVSEDASLDRVQLKEDSSTGESLTVRDEWKLFAAAIDRALFVVMGIIMVAVHHL
ncbi:neuronal acetylcholine receptor subunit alpha-2 [Caerostris extrusa]|uniref:Neuronal acetylcholine receptor subunit alpha-2 n=1 Tax=Caerostris extrusa TaxID=172846 RepID=A0AAV4PWB5_CAEEX|nr:neuronal acetylcholine receptor subunit alpha-2 [Caerostris extrusa]